MKNKFLYLIPAVFFIVLIVSGLVFLLNYKTTQIKDSNVSNSLFIPNFNNVRGVSVRDSEKWIASQTAIRLKDRKVTFFTQKDGLVANNTTGVINHNGQIWFASQGGVSKYLDRENRFKTYLIGESNIGLFEDSYDKNLYASTFENFFVYSDSSDQWTQVTDSNIPINVSNVVFTAKNIFGSSYPYALPVVVYDKDQKQWTKSNIPEFGSQQTLTLFNVGERVFVYGRSKGYNGCGEIGKEPSSIFFEYKGREWLPVEGLNKAFYNLEPSVKKEESIANSITFHAAEKPCESNDKYISIVVNFSDDKIVVSEPTSTTGANNANNYNQIVQEISEITKLKPYHKALSLENDVILTQASDNAGSGDRTGSLYLTQINFNGLKYEEKELLSKKTLGEVNLLNLISCEGGDTKYLIAAYASDYDGSSKNIQLYELRGNNVRKINTDVSGIPVGSPSPVVCFKNSIYWIENANIKKADVSGDKISIEVVKDLKDLGGVDAKIGLLKDEKLWFSYFDKKDKIFSFDLTEKNISSYNIPLPMDNLTLLDASPDYLWFKYYLNPNSEIVKIDQTGNAVKRYAITGSVSGFLNLSTDKYLISSDKQLSILSDNDSGKIQPLDDKLLAFYDQQTNFMGQRSSFDFLSSQDNVLFKVDSYAETGFFILPKTVIMK